jgi:sialate O-acetylesterase
VCAAAGGTPIEAWLPESVIQNYPKHAERLSPWKIPGEVRRAERESAAHNAKWHTQLNENDPGLHQKWMEPGFDDTGWEESAMVVKMAASIPDETMSGDMYATIPFLPGRSAQPFYGSVWLRKKIVLTDETVKIATLSLGRAADSVTVYVNGQRVFNVGYQYPPCVGAVPENILTPGENTLAVRLVGESQPPRFIPGKAYEWVSGGGKLDLTEGWKYKTGHEMPMMPPGCWFYGLPCAVYETMLAPVLPYAYDGMIWYQGESNIHEPDDYRELFEAFARNVRSRNRSELPIIFTLLARYDDPGDPGNKKLKAIREQQRRCLEIPDTGMVDAYDCGEWNDIHPLDKRTVGRRLAERAKALLYSAGT